VAEEYFLGNKDIAINKTMDKSLSIKSVIIQTEHLFCAKAERPNYHRRQYVRPAVTPEGAYSRSWRREEVYPAYPPVPFGRR